MDEGRRKKLLALYWTILKRRRDERNLKKTKRKVWVKEIFRTRDEEGAFVLTISKLRHLEDRENYFR